MSNKRHKPDEIVTKLRQVEVLRGQGMAMADAVRQIGVCELTYYRWRKQYGGMSRDQLRQLKDLQKENEHQRRHMMQEWGNLIDAWVGGQNTPRRSIRPPWTFLSRSLAFDRTGLPERNVGCRRTLGRLRLGGPAAFFKPSLHFAEVPHDGSRGQVEALRKLAALFYVVDGRVGQGNDLSKLVPADGAFAERGRCLAHRPAPPSAILPFHVFMPDLL